MSSSHNGSPSAFTQVSLLRSNVNRSSRAVAQSRGFVPQQTCNLSDESNWLPRQNLLSFFIVFPVLTTKLSCSTRVFADFLRPKSGRQAISMQTEIALPLIVPGMKSVSGVRTMSIGPWDRFRSTALQMRCRIKRKFKYTFCVLLNSW